MVSLCDAEASPLVKVIVPCSWCQDFGKMRGFLALTVKFWSFSLSTKAKIRFWYFPVRTGGPALASDFVKVGTCLFGNCQVTLQNPSDQACESEVIATKIGLLVPYERKDEVIGSVTSRYRQRTRVWLPLEAGYEAQFETRASPICIVQTSVVSWSWSLKPGYGKLPEGSW